MPRAVRIHDFGGPEVLSIEEIPVPQPGPGEVRLRVKAIGLNRTEITFRSGRSLVKPNLPAPIGFEAAGLIDALGPGVEGFAVGDRVAIIPSFSAWDYGLYGEVSLAPARSLVVIASTTSWEDAAATWVAFATAWIGLIDVGGLAAGQIALISAASSGVGLAAIQIARKVGAVPVALTRTSGKVASLRAAGAAHVITTQDQDLGAEVDRISSGKGADLVFDPVAGPGFAQLVEAMTMGGRLVVYGGLGGPTATVPVLPLLAGGLTISGYGLTSATRDDARLARLKAEIGASLASGDFKPTIARAFPFDRIADAHHYLESGEQVGKVVVTI